MGHQRKIAMCIGLAVAGLPLPALAAVTAAAPSAATAPAGNPALQAQMARMAKELAALKKNQAASQRKQAQLEKQIARLKAQNARAASTQEAATKAQIQKLYQQVMANSRQISAQATAQAPTNNIDATMQEMFAPPTGENYFSPFRDQNPAHIRPPMHMQVGQVGDLRLYMGLQTVGRYQAITQQSAYYNTINQYAGLDPGFQTPFANLDFLASIPGKLDVFFDTYVASRPHPNTMYGHQGYILLKQLPPPFAGGPLGALFNYINVKACAFDIDFGDQNYHRSNNAYVERNPLIGNYLVDPNTEEIGAEVYSVKGPVYWLVGAGSGTTTEHFDYGSLPDVHGKLWGYPLKDVRLSFSAYYDNLAGASRGTEVSHLYSAERSGGVYAAVFGGGDNPGQITPLDGLDMQAYQMDITWNHWPWEMYSFVGWTGDSAYRERWLYGSAEAVYHINAALYLAGRFSYAVAGAVHPTGAASGVDSSGWVDRFQVGGGYWLTKDLLAKLEYVYQQYNNFDPNTGVVDGVEAYHNPRFSGVVMEVSFGF